MIIIILFECLQLIFVGLDVYNAAGLNCLYFIMLIYFIVF